MGSSRRWVLVADWLALSSRRLAPTSPGPGPPSVGSKQVNRVGKKRNGKEKKSKTVRRSFSSSLLPERFRLALRSAAKRSISQLKDMSERLPQGGYEASGDEQNGLYPVDLAGVQKLLNDTNVSQILSAPIQPGFTKVVLGQNAMLNGIIEAPGMNKSGLSPTAAGLNMNFKHIRNGEACLSNCRSGYMDGKDTRPFQNVENGSKNRSPTFTDKQVEAEWTEQYEAGVYITLIALRDGSRELKRVRFSRSKFAEQQAEIWWSEHRYKVHEKYNIRVMERSSLALSTQSAG